MVWGSVVVRVDVDDVVPIFEVDGEPLSFGRQLVKNIRTRESDNII